MDSTAYRQTVYSARANSAAWLCLRPHLLTHWTYHQHWQLKLHCFPGMQHRLWKHRSVRIVITVRLLQYAHRHSAWLRWLSRFVQIKAWQRELFHNIEWHFETIARIGREDNPWRSQKSVIADRNRASSVEQKCAMAYEWGGEKMQCNKLPTSGTMVS